MTTRTTEISPQVYARVGGILYLLIIFAGALGQIFTRGRLIVPGNVESTAINIMNSQLLWRVSIAVDIMMHVFDIPLMLIMYELLKPVNKNLAFLAVLFNLIQTAVLVTNKLVLLMPLFLLGNVDYLKVFEPSQLYALTSLFIEVHDNGFAIGLIFFGLACLCYGYLLFRSGYFPKVLGVLMVLVGLSYLSNSFTFILAPAYSGKVVLVLALALIGELSFCLWLLFKGVDKELWKKAVVPTV